MSAQKDLKQQIDNTEVKVKKHEFSQKTYIFRYDQQAPPKRVKEQKELQVDFTCTLTYTNIKPISLNVVAGVHGKIIKTIEFFKGASTYNFGGTFNIEQLALPKKI